MGECGAATKDWASDRRAFIALWGLPGAAMLAALLLAMAGLVVASAIGAAPLGPHGWSL